MMGILTEGFNKAHWLTTKTKYKDTKLKYKFLVIPSTLQTKLAMNPKKEIYIECFKCMTSYLPVWCWLMNRDTRYDTENTKCKLHLMHRTQ